MRKALIVIDVQNDYFPSGNFPLWNADKTLTHIELAIANAIKNKVEIIHVQHIANPDNGVSPFFNEDSEGVQIHPRILAAAPDAPIVIKRHADGFHHTNLDNILQAQDIQELFICGMMTQNCVTHTAISKAAEKYQVSILADCCTTVDEMIHGIALSAVSTRVVLRQSTEVFS
ncbi:cysteine hydrolase family protein [Undibacterium flavidum]|nr:cysteine hydrolase family protein [Undibacterium flavidum]